MDRRMRLTCFYFGVFCALFSSTYTASVYKPKHIITEILTLTEKLLHQMPPVSDDLILSTPQWDVWHTHRECLKTYLNIFESGVQNVSIHTAYNDTVKSISEHIMNCIEKLKDRCAKIKEESDHIQKCENKTEARAAYIFMENLENFSRFLNRKDLCRNTVSYQDYYYENELNAC